MTNNSLGAYVAAAFLLGAGSALAASTTDTLTVSANVLDVARIVSVGDLSFTDYDPTELTTPNDADGSVTVRATKGLNYKIYIGSDRQMTNGVDDLDYELYADAGRSAVWGTTSASAETFASTGNAPSAKTIYGRIAAGQDVEAGNYSDTVTITLEW
ncbi:MAG: Csu type fimbrial protein [Candidatus Binatia bacterium]